MSITGIVDPDVNKGGTHILGVPIIGDESVLTQYPPGKVALINGLGSTSSTAARSHLFHKYRSRGYDFVTFIHPAAIVSKNVRLGQGVQVMAGAVIQAGCMIEDNAIVNTKSSLDHDCAIGESVHIAPGVSISGSVRIGARTHIGTGVTVIQGITIGENCMVGAGAVVVKDIAAGLKAMGVPARVI